MLLTQLTCSTAQVPEATVWYGPDTYMGANLAQLLQWLAQMPDEEVCCLICFDFVDAIAQLECQQDSKMES